MAGPQTPPRRSATWSALWLNSILITGAAALIPWIAMAFDNEDIEAIESPLVLSVARQFESGPAGLYGPYGGAYPLVLIHAPLYYRLALLAAWPVWRAGVEPIAASLAAGRLISALGFLMTLAAAYRLGRLGGRSARAGGWAALLVAAMPVCGGFAFEVRPDMLGVALQSVGIMLVLSALGESTRPQRDLTAAFACFALALCVKQHFVMAPLVSLFLILEAGWRGQIALRTIRRCLAISVMIIVFYYGAEEWFTAGRMSQSALVAASAVGNVHPANWFAAGNFFVVCMWKCTGLILMFAATGLALVLNRPGSARSGMTMVGTSLIGLISALTCVQFFRLERWCGILIVLGLIPVLAVVIPASLVRERSMRGDWLDGALWAYGACEMVLAAVFWRISTGAWYNYALEAVVIACVLTARALDRVLAATTTTSWRPLVPIGLAALAVPAFAFTDVKQVLARRRDEAAQVRGVVEAVRRPAAELFFVDRPGTNRQHGQSALVYDPWLYPVFESLSLAEPRSIWVERALVSGPVHTVATMSSQPRIDGLQRSLPELGYQLSMRTGGYFVWSRPIEVKH